MQQTYGRCPGMQEDDSEQGKQEDPKLRIAWQYRRYIQRQQNNPDPAEPAQIHKQRSTDPLLTSPVRSAPAGTVCHTCHDN